MSDFIFYYNKNNKDLFGKLTLPELFRTIFSIGQQCQLLSSTKEKDIYHIKNERFEFFLLGNFTFYKGFHVDLDTLIKNNSINHDELDRTFRKINGTYCCIIFDNLLNQFNLISDYLGFYPIYFYEDQNICLFSSELKYFKLFEKIDFQLNEEAIFSYLNNGHLILDQTWYKKITRARPASIYSLNLKTGSLKTEFYWTWAKVQKMNLPKAEFIEKYALLFSKGIENLDLNSNLKIGLSLSGGLDSRWIAQIASNNFNIEAFTFSTNRNDEFRLAERVAASLHIKHQNPIIQKENWLVNRLQEFWKTDGLLHLGHLHEGNIHAEVHSSYSHCFHGFYGGGIYAGSNECNQQITDKIAKAHLAFHDSQTNAEDAFYKMDSIDPYMVDQKIRYQSAYSIQLLSAYCKMIIPFYNMDWLEFNYSIDDKLQLNSKLYLEVLNENLSEGLLNIPWQRTGLIPKHVLFNTLSIKLKIPGILESVSQCLHESRHFINYHYFDKEIDRWLHEFQSDIMNLQLNYPINSRERKLRMLSLVVWLRMNSKNRADVL